MGKSRVTGRPRSEKAREAILEAALALLVARGYAGLSIEAVAAAAGAGKTTVYRWWSSKAELAVDAFFYGTAEELRLPDTGAAREDFCRQIRDLGDLLRGDRGKALATMLGAGRLDPELGRALGARWLEPRRRWGFERMIRASRDGDLKPGVEPTAALAVLYGPLYAPLLFGGEVPSAKDVEGYLAIACEGVFAK